jgi:hypothetical protein
MSTNQFRAKTTYVMWCEELVWNADVLEVVCLCTVVLLLAVPLHVTKVLREGNRYSSYPFSTSALDGVSGQRHAPGKGPPVPLYRSLGAPQSRSGHRG